MGVLDRFIQIAKKAGVDIAKASWNIRRMPHQGGHTKAYYTAVRDNVDEAYRRYLQSGSKWNAAKIESELKKVAERISKGIDNGTISLYNR